MQSMRRNFVKGLTPYDAGVLRRPFLLSS